jgi:putative hydrolase of the HAD superfamily
VEKQEQIHLLPGIPEILEMAGKAGVFLGMISNGSPAHQRMKYHALGLEAYIPPARLLVSGDAGVHKPDPAIFHLYLEKMNLEAGECWYIGDSYENDIIPANKTGLHTILVRWEEDPVHKTYEKAEQRFSSVEELKKFLKDLLI